MTERHQIVIRMWNEGAPASEIGGVLGVSANAVEKIVQYLRNQGHDLPRRQPQPRSETGPRLGTPYDQMMAGTWEKVA